MRTTSDIHNGYKSAAQNSGSNSISSSIKMNAPKASLSSALCGTCGGVVLDRSLAKHRRMITSKPYKGPALCCCTVTPGQQVSTLQNSKVIVLQDVIVKPDANVKASMPLLLGPQAVSIREEGVGNRALVSLKAPMLRNMLLQPGCSKPPVKAAGGLKTPGEATGRVLNKTPAKIAKVKPQSMIVKADANAISWSRQEVSDILAFSIKDANIVLKKVSTSQTYSQEIPRSQEEASTSQRCSQSSSQGVRNLEVITTNILAEMFSPEHVSTQNSGFDSNVVAEMSTTAFEKEFKTNAHAVPDVSSYQPLSHAGGNNTLHESFSFSSAMGGEVVGPNTFVDAVAGPSTSEPATSAAKVLSCSAAPAMLDIEYHTSAGPTNQEGHHSRGVPAPAVVTMEAVAEVCTNPDAKLPMEWCLDEPAFEKYVLFSVNEKDGLQKEPAPTNTSTKVLVGADSGEDSEGRVIVWDNAEGVNVREVSDPSGDSDSSSDEDEKELGEIRAGIQGYVCRLKTITKRKKAGIKRLAKKLAGFQTVIADKVSRIDEGGNILRKLTALEKRRKKLSARQGKYLEALIAANLLLQQVSRG